MPPDVIQFPKPPSAEADGVPTRFRLHAPRRDVAAERRRLARDLAGAMRDDSFLLHFQPRVTLVSGVAIAAEALIRWPHRKQGLIPPSIFIPIAEGSGQIVAIGAWVLQAACREAAEWRVPWRISVNVSARQLVGGALLGQVADALDSSGLPAERLELELTESMLIDVDTETLLALSAVRDLGVGLALDDFGTGYASLSLLKRLPLTVMKLDRSLVRDLPTDREDAAIVRAVIATGHALGLTVVAEGIECEAQRAFLTGCNCDEGQGYLFSQPLPADRLRALQPA